MFTVLRQRNFALLWFGQLISMAGDWLLVIALPFYIYELTGSTLATGAMFIAQLLPSLLLGSVAGVFVDRWDRRRVMIVSDLLRGLVLLLLLVVRSTDQLWLIYIVAFLQSALGQFFIPAKNAIIPRLLAGENLVRANSLTAMSDSLTRLAGPSLGGVMFATLGLSSVVFVDALSFFVSAAMIAWMVVPSITALGSPTGAGEVGSPNPSGSGDPTRRLRLLERDRVGVRLAPLHSASMIEAALTQAYRLVQSLAGIWSSIWTEWLAGLRFVRSDRMLAPLFLVLSVFSLADAVFSTLLVAFARSVMHVGTPELGWLMASQGLGGLLGGVVLAKLGDRIPPQRWIALACIVDGLLLFAIFNAPVLGFALVLIFLAGILMVGAIVSINILLQTAAADSYRGRVYGAWLTTGGLMRLIGTLLAASLAEVVGVLPVLDSGAFLWLVAGILTVAFLPGVIGQSAVLHMPVVPSRPSA